MAQCTSLADQRPLLRVLFTQCVKLTHCGEILITYPSVRMRVSPFNYSADLDIIWYSVFTLYVVVEKYFTSLCVCRLM
jgi:hypothetical protein